MATLETLPEEVLDLIFRQIACIFGLRRLLRLRLVSKSFDVHVMDEFVFASTTHKSDIVRCEDKTIIMKYLHWCQYHNPAENVDIFQMFNKLALHFAEMSGHDHDTVLHKLHALFAYELISQRRQHQHGIDEEAVRSRTTLIRYMAAPLVWWSARIHTIETDASEAYMSLACAFGDQDLVLNLLDKDGLNTDRMRRPLLGHPIQAAVRFGHKQLVRLLLEYGSLTAFNHNWTILKDAILCRHHHVLAMLLGMELEYPESDALREYPDTGDAFGDALTTAFRLNDQVSIDLLITTTPHPLTLKLLRHLLLAACLAPASEPARTMLASYPSLNVNYALPWTLSGVLIPNIYCNYITPLAAAGHMGHDKLIKDLLARDADPNHDTGCSKSPLLPAAKLGHTRCVQLLLHAGARYTYYFSVQRCLLEAAARSGNTSTVKSLLDHSVRTGDLFNDDDEQSGLTMAHIEGVQSMIDLLVDYGFNNDQAIQRARAMPDCRRINSVTLDETSRPRFKLFLGDYRSTARTCARRT